jgi:hypothetical protein
MTVAEILNSNKEFLGTLINNGITLKINKETQRNINIYYKIESFIKQGKSLNWACYELEVETKISYLQIYRIYKIYSNEIKTGL